MRNREIKLKPLAASILSLSLLTVMAGAAVAPALEVIRRHFSGGKPARGAACCVHAGAVYRDNEYVLRPPCLALRRAHADYGRPCALHGRRRCGRLIQFDLGSACHARARRRWRRHNHAAVNRAFDLLLCAGKARGADGPVIGGKPARRRLPSRSCRGWPREP